MSQAIILQLADQIRSNPADSVGVFLARLCAWIKLSDEARLSGSELFPIDGAFSWKQLRATYEAVGSADSLLGVAAAFSDPGGNVSAIDHLDDEQLAALGITLRQAIDGGTFDYQEAFIACFDLAAREGRHRGLPDDVARLMCSLARNSYTAQRVYCPWEGSLLLAVHASRQGHKVTLETTMLSPWPALANILAAEEPIKIVRGDPIQSPSQAKGLELDTFDLSIASPPFGDRASTHVPDIYKRFRHEAFYTQTLQIQHLLAQTRGRIVLTVPDGFLARATSGERFLKEEMLRRGQIAAVVALPSNILYGNPVSHSIMVIDTEGGHEEVFFVDLRDHDHGFVTRKIMRSRTEARRNQLQRIDDIVAIVSERKESEFSRLVSIDECIQTRGNLAPNRYLAANDTLAGSRTSNIGPTKELKDLADLIRPQMVRARHDENATARWAEIGHDEIPEAGYICGPGRPVAVDQRMEYRAEDFALQGNDILVSFRGTIGRVGIVSPDYDEAISSDTVETIPRWLASQGFLIVRVKNDVIRPAVLYLYLKSKLGEQMLKSRAAGATVPAIQAQDLNELPIPVPSKAMQEKWQRAFDDEVEWAKAIKELRAKIAGLRAPGFFGA